MKTATMPFVAGTVGLVAALLSIPASASAQNLFVSCPGDNSIVEISSDGIVSPFASGLHDPADLAFDSAGDLFEADEASGKIYEFVNDGGTLDPTPVLYASNLDEPYGLAFGVLGLYVSEYGNGDVVRITDGTISSVASGLGGPEGLAYSAPGALYVADQEEGFITEISILEGTRTIIAAGLNSPSGLAAASAKIVYVSNQGANNIDEIVSTPEPFASGLDDPSGIAFYGTKLYEADSGTGDINAFTKPPIGNVNETTFATGLDDPVGLAFQPVPEPPAWGFLAVCASMLVARSRWRKITVLNR